MQRYVNRGTGKSNVQLIIRFILLISFDNTIKPHPGYSGVAYPELPIPAFILHGNGRCLWDAPVLVGSTHWVCFIHTGGHTEVDRPGMKLAALDLKKEKKHDGWRFQ